MRRRFSRIQLFIKLFWFGILLTPKRSNLTILWGNSKILSTTGWLWEGSLSSSMIRTSPVANILTKYIYSMNGFFPTGVFSSIRFLYIFVKLNMCSTIRKQLNYHFNFFFFFAFFSFLFSFLFFYHVTFHWQCSSLQNCIIILCTFVPCYWT